MATLTLKEHGGQTAMTTTVAYPSDVRDGWLKSPMDTGVAAGYDTLDAVLASLR